MFWRSLDENWCKAWPVWRGVDPPPFCVAPAFPLHFCPDTPSAAPRGWRGSWGTVGTWPGQDHAGLSQIRGHGGELMGSVSPAGTAPGGLLGCPEHRSGSHQPFLLVSPLVQDRNHQSPEVPSSRMCTLPSASSSPSSTTRQVRVPFCRWRWPAATSWGEVSPQPHLSVLCWRIYTLYLLQHLSVTASSPLRSVPAISTMLSPSAMPAGWKIPSPLRARGTEARLWVRPFA